MIKEVFYTEGTTYIKDTEGKEIKTQNLSFSDAFEFAWKNDVDFDYEIISIEDEYDFSYFLSTKIGDYDNRNIVKFFDQCQKNGINKITNNNPDLFGRVGVRRTINDIVDDYNDDVAIYNIECYGTDIYIARIVYEQLFASIKLNKNNCQLYALLKTVDEGDYNLNIFLEILEQFNFINSIK